MKNLTILLFLLFSTYCFSQDTISTAQAKDYMDKLVCVKGKVASFKLAPEGKNINYINIDKAFPDNVFSVVITNDHLKKLNIKIEDFIDKIIYINGTINTYKNDPKQIPQIFNPLSVELQKE